MTQTPAKMNEPPIEELKARVVELVAEKKAIEDYLGAVPEKERRLRALEGGWNLNGAIKQAQLELRDALFPELLPKRRGAWHLERIVAFDNNWFSIREDGQERVTRYRRDTGRRERARDDWGALDPVKALEIWTEWQATHPTK